MKPQVAYITAVWGDKKIENTKKREGIAGISMMRDFNVIVEWKGAKGT